MGQQVLTHVTNWLLAGETLDLDCVNALIENRQKVESIQQQFKENTFG